MNKKKTSLGYKINLYEVEDREYIEIVDDLSLFERLKTLLTGQVTVARRLKKPYKTKVGNNE